MTAATTAAVDASPAASAEQAPVSMSNESEQPRTRDLEQEQLQSLQERLQRQHQEYQASQRALTEMRAKLREAELGRRTDPAVYGLGALVIMLLIAVAALLWRVWRLQSQGHWIDAARALTEQLSPEPRSMQPTMPLKTRAPLNEATMTSMRVLSQPPLDAMDGRGGAAPATLPLASRPRREMSAEELIDLEQQADFFIAIGQEEAAIDLLMEYIRSSGGTSPMPYLKLLGIYRQRGDGEAYERVRERFNRRFNAHAPSWEEYGEQRRTLECYDAVFERIVTAWRTPSEAVDLLQALLYRRDASAEPFELPAYEELLFLYAIGRDVFEHLINPHGVDLLLPMGAGEEESAITHHEPTRPPDAWMQQVDFELDLSPPKR